MSQILIGDALTRLRELQAESVHCCVTSPPYWGLRDYGVESQLGIESTPELYVANMVEVFREVRRALRGDGTLWLNIGDSYASGGKGGGGSYMDDRREAAWQKRSDLNGWRGAPPGLKPKDLCGIPWRLAFALQADGWYLRSDIIWHKPNPMPESVTDRPTKAHEYVFLLSKSARYFYDAEAVKEPATTTRPDLLAFGDRPDVDYPGHMQNRKRKKVPAGWDPVDHGRAGKGRFTDKQREAAAASSEASQRRMSGFNDRWDASEDAGSAPLYRNARTVWTIATQAFSGAHFATFPEKLAARCIMAGCPALVCHVCGAPWVRVVEKGELRSTDGTADDYRPTKDAGGDPHIKARSEGWTPNHFRETTATGWRPACDHHGDPTPGTVLDPFGGAGTVGVVAQGLGRKYVLVEIKPEYAEMARARIHAGAPLFQEVTP